jgi:hypothetical protein
MRRELLCVVGALVVCGCATPHEPVGAEFGIATRGAAGAAAGGMGMAGGDLVEGRGLITVAWTIDGNSGDEQDCIDNDVDVISIGLTNVAGQKVGQYEAVCEVFRTSIELPAGDYLGEAELMGFDGQPRTTLAEFGRVLSVSHDKPTSVPINFSQASFYE